MCIFLWFFFCNTGADSLCGRLTEKINSNHGHRLVLAHMPLLMVCLEGLGKLAQKFPNIATTSIYCLRDFLVTPSPILFKLHRQHNDKQGKDHQFKVTSTFILFIDEYSSLSHHFIISSFLFNDYFIKPFLKLKKKTKKMKTNFFFF